MLSEVLGAVFSTRFLRFLPLLGLVAVIPSVIQQVLEIFLGSWALIATSGDPISLWRVGGGVPSTVLAVALFPVSAYFGVVLVDLCGQIHRGSVNPGLAFLGKERKTLSNIGGQLAFLVVAMGPLLLVLAVFLTSVAPSLPNLGQQTASDPQQAQALAQAFLPVAGYLLLGLFVSYIYLAYFGIRLGFYSFAIVLDGERVIPSLKKSWRLTRGNWLPVFGTFLLLGLVLTILAVVVGFGVSAPVALAFPDLKFLQILTKVQIFTFVGLVLPLGLYGGLVAYEQMKAASTPPVTPLPPPPPSARPPTPQVRRPPIVQLPPGTWKPPPPVRKT